MSGNLEHPRTNVFQAAFQAFARFMSPKRPEELVVDEEGVRRLRAGEVIERARWAQLINVTVATTDEGPFVEDFFWLLRALVAEDYSCPTPRGVGSPRKARPFVAKLLPNSLVSTLPRPSWAGTAA